MIIYMPTCDKYVQVAVMTCKLLDKYWPRHPPIELSCGDAVIDPILGVRLHTMPDQHPHMIDAMRTYLNWTREEHILLMLDDYGVFAPVDESKVAVACSAMLTSPIIASVALTWEPCETIDFNLRPFALNTFREIAPWDYTVNFQAGVWNRGALLDILNAIPGDISPWQAEVAASRWFEKHMRSQRWKILALDIPRPHNAGPFVDGTDKTNWPIKYHNLVHRGQMDRRHYRFLRQEGFDPPCLG